MTNAHDPEAAAAAPPMAQGDAALSDQTRWMLAVRDSRDRLAFGNLFDFYAPRIKALLMRGGTPAAQAEDVAQDALLTLWHKAAQFDPERAQVSAWVYRIARNRNIDIARRAARPLPEDLPEPPAPDAGAVLAMDQEANLLRQALARLKPDQRDMIARAYLGDLSHSEISAATGLPLGTIKSRIRLGLERLRFELKEIRTK